MIDSPRNPEAETAPAPWWAWCGTRDLTATDRHNLRRFNLWALAWMAAWVAATFAVRFGGERLGPAAWLLAAVPILLGVAAIVSYWQFLRHADELLRLIQLEGLALGFGSGAVFMVSYRLLERLGAPTLDTSDPLLVMVVAWAIGQWLAARRYMGGGRP